MKYSKKEQEEAKAYLLRVIKPGDIIYTDIDHVAPSGMTRWIKVFIIRDNEKINLNYDVAATLGYTFDTGKHWGIKVTGCGMDMGFDLVYQLSHVLFPTYKCYGENCKAAEHVNYHTVRDGNATHNDGYALIQRWF